MTQIRLATLPDGRSLKYNPDRLQDGGVVIEAFYLSTHFDDIDIRLWIREHKDISFKSFDVGAVLIGTKVVDECELQYLINIASSSDDQFFEQSMKQTLGE